MYKKNLLFYYLPCYNKFMETKAFINTPRLHYYFSDNPLTDLKIELLGYNDFHHLRGAKFPHQQEFYTLHMVVNGEGTLSYKGKTYQLSQGDMFLLPPKTMFSYYPKEHNPWEYIFFEFVGDKIEEVLQHTNFANDNPVSHFDNYSQLFPSFKNFFETLKISRNGSLFEASSLFYSLLNGSTTVPSNSTLPDILSEALLLIRLNFIDPYFTVQQLANELHCSHSQLCRYFKSKTGKTAITHINEFRINYAKDLLRRTNLTATQIAKMSGFNEYVYFLATFKRKTGMTTSEYREYLKKPNG